MARDGLKWMTLPFPQARDRFMAIPGVDVASKKKILWDNCARLYNLE
ncbi:MAG: hypothetical protein ACHQ7M_12080 [Chloroflexota bacterium]